MDAQAGVGFVAKIHWVYHHMAWPCAIQTLLDVLTDFRKYMYQFVSWREAISKIEPFSSRETLILQLLCKLVVPVHL